MGTPHQPRRDDAQRVIDRQTRARRELMRRQQLENVQGNIAAIRKLVDEGPAVPSMSLNQIRSTHRLTWYQRGIRAIVRAFAEIGAGVVDALGDILDGIRKVFK